MSEAGRDRVREVSLINSQTALFKEVVRSEIGKRLSEDVAERLASVIDRVGREGNIDSRYGEIKGRMYAVLFKALDEFAKTSNPTELHDVFDCLYHRFPDIETGVWLNAEETLKDGQSLVNERGH